ncbi:Polyketide cyclase/dehydrase and lipid transport superfamily protein [Euphorbia peplus]|nr:Polyketide cyclase/dehydrase and lipid transport superfamily protein [Euphorbia peplus]
MSSAAISLVSCPTNFSTKVTRHPLLFTSFKFPTCKFASFSTPICFRFHYGSLKRNGVKPFSAPVMEWQDSTVKLDVDVPVSVAYNCYLDRESIPRWMPFISSVKVLEDKPDLSRWSLKYEAFGRDIKFSWLARNMQPILNQKIHWRSLEGLPNRGAVRFFPKGPESCTVELTVSYEVPQLLAPVASALQPFLENLLKNGLERFATYAKSTMAN